MTQRNVIISDTHSGHRFGLLTPGVKLTNLQAVDDGKTIDEWEPELSEQNKYLLNIYNQLTDEASDTTDDINLFHVGEPFWGAKHPSGVIDLSEYAQVTMAMAALERWFKLPNLKRAAIVSGTDAHEFEENSALKTLVKELRMSYPNVEILAAHHLLIDVDGYLMDVQHHGPHPGTRSWLSGNMARFYLRDRIMRHLMSGSRPPDLFLSGHFHTRISEMVEADGNEHRLIVMPSFFMMTGFARRATQGEYEITNGGMFFDVTGGSASKFHWVTRTLDLRARYEWN